MKTLSQIKDIIAKKHGYKDFDDVRNNIPISRIIELTDEVAEEYASQAVDDFVSNLTNEFNMN